eukprot:gene3560-526_t
MHPKPVGGFQKGKGECGHRRLAKEHARELVCPDCGAAVVEGRLRAHTGSAVCRRQAVVHAQAALALHAGGADAGGADAGAGARHGHAGGAGAGGADAGDADAGRGQQQGNI